VSTARQVGTALGVAVLGTLLDDGRGGMTLRPALLVAAATVLAAAVALAVTPYPERRPAGARRS
jgi:predicted MFS family arabinose efflux permease